MKSVKLFAPEDTPVEVHQRMSTWLQHNMPPAISNRYALEETKQNYLILIAIGEYWLAIVCLNLFYGVLEVHAASSKESRGRWLDRRVMRLIDSVEDMLESRGCVSHVTSPLASRVLTGFGFQLIGNLAIRMREER